MDLHSTIFCYSTTMRTRTIIIVALIGLSAAMATYVGVRFDGLVRGTVGESGIPVDVGSNSVPDEEIQPIVVEATSDVVLSQEYISGIQFVFDGLTGTPVMSSVAEGLFWGRERETGRIFLSPDLAASLELASEIPGAYLATVSLIGPPDILGNPVDEGTFSTFIHGNTYFFMMMTPGQELFFCPTRGWRASREEVCPSGFEVTSQASSLALTSSTFSSRSSFSAASSALAVTSRASSLGSVSLTLHSSRSSFSAASSPTSSSAMSASAVGQYIKEFSWAPGDTPGVQNVRLIADVQGLQPASNGLFGLFARPAITGVIRTVSGLGSNISPNTLLTNLVDNHRYEIPLGPVSVLFPDGRNGALFPPREMRLDIMRGESEVLESRTITVTPRFSTTVCVGSNNLGFEAESCYRNVCFDDDEDSPASRRTSVRVYNDQGVKAEHEDRCEDESILHEQACGPIDLIHGRQAQVRRYECVDGTCRDGACIGGSPAILDPSVPRVTSLTTRRVGLGFTVQGAVEGPSGNFFRAYTENDQLLPCKRWESHLYVPYLCEVENVSPGERRTITFGVYAVPTTIGVIRSQADLQRALVGARPIHRRSVTFEIPSGCGNGTLESEKGEQCDDGNGLDGDTCGPGCTITTPASITALTFERGNSGFEVKGVVANMVDRRNFSNFTAVENGQTVNLEGCTNQDNRTTCYLYNALPGHTYAITLNMYHYYANGLFTASEVQRILSTESSPQVRLVASRTVTVTMPIGCGNGALDSASEQCDDGNLQDGDGCNSRCFLEAEIEPGQCVDPDENNPQAPYRRSMVRSKTRDGVLTTRVDTCVSATELKEQKCENAQNNTNLEYSFICPKGCVEGVCTENESVLQHTQEQLTSLEAVLDPYFVINVKGIIQSYNWTIKTSILVTRDGTTDGFSLGPDCRTEQASRNFTQERKCTIFAGKKGEYSITYNVRKEPFVFNTLHGSKTITINVPLMCGNSVRDANEQCDDGNEQDGDGCNSQCRIEELFTCTGTPSLCSPVVCGDGQMYSGNTLNSEGRVIPIPGNEQCDDGNATSGDGCSVTCQVEHGFRCPYNPLGPTRCTRCGDGKREAPEECDDGNTVSNDACSATCTLEIGARCSDASPNVCAFKRCGDGSIDSDRSEYCDDGNTLSGDGCAANCRVENGYRCDGINPSRCFSLCGDGRLDSVTTYVFPRNIEYRETCDDGNTVNGDGCSSSCIQEAGYRCVSAPSKCAICGDGLLVATVEECDDGNTLNGDGCNTFCNRELGFICDSASPTQCRRL